MRPKKTPELTSRLKTVKRLIGRCGVLADIGSDHAFLPISAVTEGLCEKAIVTDLRKGPLETAAKNIGNLCPGKASSFELRLGSGLGVLAPGEAEVISICGMGGLLMAKMLEEGGETAKRSRLVLQPNTCVPELRRFLPENGYRITYETGLCEGRHPYAVICCEYTGERGSYSDGPVDEITGRCMGRSGDRNEIAYLKAIRRKYSADLEKLKSATEKENRAGVVTEKGRGARLEKMNRLTAVIKKIDEITGEYK